MLCGMTAGEMDLLMFVRSFRNRFKTKHRAGCETYTVRIDHEPRIYFAPAAGIKKYFLPASVRKHIMMPYSGCGDSPLCRVLVPPNAGA